MSDETKPTIREACRRRMPLGGPDAQALEGALQQVERELALSVRALERVGRERDEARGDAERLRALLVEEVRLSYCYAAPGDNDVLGQSYCDPKDPCWICRARAALSPEAPKPAVDPTIGPYGTLAR